MAVGRDPRRQHPGATARPVEAEATAILAAEATPEGGVLLLLRDDGHGCDPARASAGNGLRNLHWRAQALGAQLDWPAADQGRTLRLRLPPPAGAAAAGP